MSLRDNKQTVKKINAHEKNLLAFQQITSFFPLLTIDPTCHFVLNNIHTPTNRQAKNTDFETRTHIRRISQLLDFSTVMESTKLVLDFPFYLLSL